MRMLICNEGHNKTNIQLTLSGGIGSCLHGNGAFDVSTEALDEDTDRDDTAIEDTISGDTFRRRGDSAAVAIEDDGFLSNVEIMFYIKFSLLEQRIAKVFSDDVWISWCHHHIYFNQKF